MTRHADIEDSPLVAEKCPLLGEAARLIGHRTIRNRGTIGGSLAHADPVAELPAVLVALDGEVIAAGPAGERPVRANAFFVTVCTSSLAPNEILREVRIPVLPRGTGTAFVKLARRHGDYGIVGVAAAVTPDRVTRIALAGVGDVPHRCHDAEDYLRGRVLDKASIAEAAARCAAAVEPEGDLHASADYKRAMVDVFVRRALAAAASRRGKA